MTEEKSTKGLATFSSKKMLNEHAEKGTKIRYTDRLKVEIVKDTRYYKKGQIVTPHLVMGQALIDQGIAKKVIKD